MNHLIEVPCKQLQTKGGLPVFQDRYGRVFSVNESERCRRPVTVNQIGNFAKVMIEVKGAAEAYLKADLQWVDGGVGYAM